VKACDPKTGLILDNQACEQKFNLNSVECSANPVLGAPATTAVVRQMKLFPYPELPAYNGYGDVDDAASYAGKVSKALQQPITWLGKFDTTKIWCNSQGLDCRETSGPL
jgi:hypothetical protein